MGNPLIERRLIEGRGVAAVWQLREDGLSPGAIAHAVGSMRQIHDGVYLSGHAPPTEWQLWRAATLTTPRTALGDWSCATYRKMREGRDRMPTTVRRTGNAGRRLAGQPGRHLGRLRVRHSKLLDHEVELVDGIPCTTVPRTLLDLMPQMGQVRADRMVRDVLRSDLATAAELHALIADHRGARGVARLRVLVEEYAALPMKRGRSDAEVLALALLKAAGYPTPELNVVVDGGEGDLVWRLQKKIVELDGPRNHGFPTYDARKQARWERAGWTVGRLPTDDVYDRPQLLFALAPSRLQSDPLPAPNVHRPHLQQR